MSWKKGQAVQLLPFSDAKGRVLEIYRDVQHVFGVPHISSFFQYLGTNPRFLDKFWTAIRPVAESEAFFTCAHRLRADAYARIHTNFDIPDLNAEVVRQQFSLGAREELKDCINFFCHSVPMSLLLASYLSESFAGTAGNAEIARTPAAVPKAPRRIVMVDEDSVNPAVKAIFADIRATTGADVVHTVYRAFARWPDFVQAYWTTVKPIMVSDKFQRCESTVREEALQITRELPGPVRFSAADLAATGLHEAEAGSLIHITEMFVHSLAAALLNVSVARIGLEGGSVHAQASPEKSEVPLT